ncbi:class I SAM-dependent methyltransferase [Candidatus Methylopumilus universalis]|jgi:hypothetical protein|uniref:class I SAM-dependent methyltransferase n=1 Tax=Candidatus Methylopumilus universalis TaxID=2588536 RepID=UPI00111FCFC2|nr:class I SAM-dependent methyltransferase [Candidatus Methylopumilus universalis]QDC89400.1 class I SAM-dependent methyltransferase [Candidatus Methylopumilus universalis]QDC90701.1 class I SAM-dependent methyltransferase [Candidatus Methylopumilus universalis]
MPQNINEIVSCEVCDNKSLNSVVKLGLHPMCDDLIPIGSDKTCREYPIEILFCPVCFTAHQKYQVPKRDLFPKQYHYRSRFTSDVLDGMKNLVKTCEINFGSLKDKKILDIGCNDGSLLDFFHKAGALTFGVEPTGAADDAKAKEMHIIVNNFLSKEAASDLLKKYGTFDFITFTNVFAHIEDLKSLIEALKLIMSDDTVIIIENHYLGSVLEKNQFDTFYHEHPRTYSYQSFKYIANLLKVDLIHVEFPNRYGGNIRVFLGKKSINLSIIDGLEVIKKNEENFYSHFLNMQIDIEKWKSRKKKAIEEYVRNFGKIPAKAFPGRSAILVKLLNIDESLISAIYEKPGSLKIGHYVPGTRIPILSDDELFMQSNQKPILNLAWHISSEIKNYLKLHNYQGEVLDIINQTDFS